MLWNDLGTLHLFEHIKASYKKSAAGAAGFYLHQGIVYLRHNNGGIFCHLQNFSSIYTLGEERNAPLPLSLSAIFAYCQERIVDGIPHKRLHLVPCAVIQSAVVI